LLHTLILSQRLLSEPFFEQASRESTSPHLSDQQIVTGVHAILKLGDPATKHHNQSHVDENANEWHTQTKKNWHSSS
jgi:hypothetical protein